MILISSRCSTLRRKRDRSAQGIWAAARWESGDDWRLFAILAAEIILPVRSILHCLNLNSTDTGSTCVQAGLLLEGDGSLPERAVAAACSANRIHMVADAAVYLIFFRCYSRLFTTRCF
jgi:hypothetical protein